MAKGSECVVLSDTAIHPALDTLCWQFQVARQQGVDLRKFPYTFRDFPIIPPGFNWAELVLSQVQQVPHLAQMHPSRLLQAQQWSLHQMHRPADVQELV